MHVLAVVVPANVVSFDLSVPVELFGRVRTEEGQPGYDVRVCAETDEVSAGAFRIRAPYDLGELERAQTIVLPGIHDVRVPPSQALISAVRTAAARGARVASICSGAFLLAATGLLDGKTATTHWLATSELARRFPAIRVDPDVLYVDEGQVLTSAGAAAALDLCLHLVRHDYGAAAAAFAARVSVMPLEREGGQSQFIVAPPPTDETSLAPLLAWLDDHAASPLSLADIASAGSMSVRTLNRRFREQTGTTPLQWLIRARIRRAQGLLETTALSIDRVAESVGFHSTSVFREHFRRVVCTSPTTYRRAFRR
jgi:transcriptional regulator GlxA family with amidase domain